MEQSNVRVLQAHIHRVKTVSDVLNWIFVHNKQYPLIQEPWTIGGELKLIKRKAENLNPDLKTILPIPFSINSDLTVIRAQLPLPTGAREDIIALAYFLGTTYCSKKVKEEVMEDLLSRNRKSTKGLQTSVTNLEIQV